MFVFAFIKFSYPLPLYEDMRSKTPYLYLLFALIGFQSALAQQPRDLSGLIERLPQSQSSTNLEVRLGFESLQTTIATTSINAAGRFRLDLQGQDAIPAGAYKPLLQALRLERCSFVPAITPAGAQAATAAGLNKQYWFRSTTAWFAAGTYPSAYLNLYSEHSRYSINILNTSS
jgi:hypothetical protein